MQILISADTSDNSSESLLDRVRDTVGAALHRYGMHVSRAEVQLSHAQTGNDDGPGQRCRIEVRLRGCQPLSVEHAARSIEMAVDGALSNLTRVIDGARQSSPGRGGAATDKSSDKTGLGVPT